MAQIVPNGIRIVIKFLMLCVEHGIEPTIELFRFCFQFRKAAQCLGYKTFHARSNLKIITPDNNAGWRPKYLFAQVPGWESPEEWNFSEFSDPPKKRSCSAPPGYDKLRNLPAQYANRMLESELVQYGLSPAQLEPSQKPTTRASKKGRKYYMQPNIPSRVQ